MRNFRLRSLTSLCNHQLHNERQEAALTTSTARTLIAVLQVALDGRILDGASDSVDSWADGLELLPPVDAFVLGAGMWSGYEPFWSAMRDDRAAAAEMLGRDPYPRELAYAEVASRTEHVVLSTTLADVAWPSARLIRSIEEIRSFKDDGEGTVYVVGGPTLISSLLDAALLDELLLIVHPIVLGAGRSIGDVLGSPHRLELMGTEHRAGERVTLTYRLVRAG
jgi:dihydrofolate reductase